MKQSFSTQTNYLWNPESTPRAGIYPEASTVSCTFLCIQKESCPSSRERKWLPRLPGSQCLNCHPAFLYLLSMQHEQTMMKRNKNLLHIPPGNNFIFAMFPEGMMRWRKTCLAACSTSLQSWLVACNPLWESSINYVLWIIIRLKNRKRRERTVFGN